MVFASRPQTPPKAPSACRNHLLPGPWRPSNLTCVDRSSASILSIGAWDLAFNWQYERTGLTARVCRGGTVAQRSHPANDGRPARPGPCDSSPAIGDRCEYQVRTRSGGQDSISSLSARADLSCLRDTVWLACIKATCTILISIHSVLRSYHRFVIMRQSIQFAVAALYASRCCATDPLTPEKVEADILTEE
jgi:hypothetical protein